MRARPGFTMGMAYALGDIFRTVGAGVRRAMPWVRRAAAWLLVRVAWLILIPILLAFMLFALAMALLVEGPYLLAFLALPDWAACWRRCRRAAHVTWAGWDGPTLTGRHGFGGRGAAEPDALEYHGGVFPHFRITNRGWAVLGPRLRAGIVQPTGFANATARLGGGYDGLPLYVDWCPCR